MCLAVPMKVVEVRENVARVASGGMEKDVYLDIVDRIPKEGDYVIVHAGFAIHTMGAKDAQKSIQLFEEMAKGVVG